MLENVWSGRAVCVCVYMFAIVAFESNSALMDCTWIQIDENFWELKLVGEQKTEGEKEKKNIVYVIESLIL